MAAFTTNLTLGAGSFVRNVELNENVSVAGKRTRGNSLATLVAGPDTLLVGDQHATIKDDAMVYDLQIGAVNRLRFSGFTTFNLGEGNDVLDLTVQPKNATSAWTAAITANGGSGDDVIWSGGGVDTLNGDAGLDRIWGGAGNDTINGGDNADTLYGSAGNDILNGGDGDDQLFGGAGNDSIRGNLGNDVVQGGAGADVITAGADTGSLTNGSSRTNFTLGDLVRGGSEADKFLWRTGDGADAILDFVDGTDRVLIQGSTSQTNNAGAITVDGVTYAAGTSTVFSTSGVGRVIVLGVKSSSLTFAATESIDGVLFTAFG